MLKLRRNPDSVSSMVCFNPFSFAAPFAGAISYWAGGGGAAGAPPSSG